MKLSTLVNSKDALTSLTKQNLPIEIAWKLKKFIAKANEQIVAYESLRNEKIIGYGEEVMDGDKKTGNMKVKDENVVVFLQEMQVVLEKEIDIEIPEIKMDEILEYNKRLSKPAEINISEMMILDWLLV